MSIQAAQFAATFERLGRRMLDQLESFPEELWDRAPLIHHRDAPGVGPASRCDHELVCGGTSCLSRDVWC
jgi:hypothetical protein